MYIQCIETKMDFIEVMSQDWKKARIAYVQSLCLIFVYFLTARAVGRVMHHNNFFLLLIDLGVIDL